MKTIAAFSAKGGAGKTTVSVLSAIAARHIEQKKVIVIDADAGQHSALGWSATFTNLKLPVIAVDDTRGLVEAISAAAEKGYDFCFVDTPPRSPALALEALDRSDLVVVPAQVGLTDRLSTYASIDRVVASTRPYLVALSDAPPRYAGRDGPDVRAIRGELAYLGNALWSGQITSRAIIARGFVGARDRAGEDRDDGEDIRPTTTEIVALWCELRRRLDMFDA